MTYTQGLSTNPYTNDEMYKKVSQQVESAGYNDSIFGDSKDYSSAYNDVLDTFHTERDANAKETAAKEAEAEAAAKKKNAQEAKEEAAAASGTDEAQAAGQTPGVNSEGYSQQKLDKVNDILESKEAQKKFSQLTDLIQDITNISSEGGWNALGDAILGTLTLGIHTIWKGDKAASGGKQIKEMLSSMSNEELVAFQTYFYQQTGQDLTQLLSSSVCDGRWSAMAQATGINNEFVDGLTKKMDEADDYMKEIPEDEAEANKPLTRGEAREKENTEAEYDYLNNIYSKIRSHQKELSDYPDMGFSSIEELEARLEELEAILDKYDNPDTKKSQPEDTATPAYRPQENPEAVTV